MVWFRGKLFHVYGMQQLIIETRGRSLQSPFILLFFDTITFSIILLLYNQSIYAHSKILQQCGDIYVRMQYLLDLLISLLSSSVLLYCSLVPYMQLNIQNQMVLYKWSKFSMFWSKQRFRTQISPHYHSVFECVQCIQLLQSECNCTGEKKSRNMRSDLQMKNKKS